MSFFEQPQKKCARIGGAYDGEGDEAVHANDPLDLAPREIWTLVAQYITEPKTWLDFRATCKLFLEVAGEPREEFEIEWLHVVSDWNRDSPSEGGLQRGYVSALAALGQAGLGDGLVAVGYGPSPYLRVLDTRNKRAVKTLPGHTGLVNCLCVFQGLLASGADDHSVKLWDVAQGRCEQTLVGHSYGVYALTAWGPFLVSAGNDREIRVWAADGSCVLTITLLHSSAWSLAGWGDFLVSGDSEGQVAMWNRGGEMVRSWQAHSSRASRVTSLLVLNDSATLATASTCSQFVKLWDIEGRLLRELDCGHGVWGLHLAFGGALVVEAGYQPVRLQIWDLQSGQKLKTLDAPSWSKCRVSGKSLVAVGYDKVTVWRGIWP